MKIQIRERDKRALLLLGGALALYLMVTVGVFPAFDQLNGSASTAAQKQEQLMKYRRAQVRRGNYVRLLEQARKNVADAEAMLIRGDNPSLASVELQTIVEDAAKKVEINFSQRNISAARKKDDFFNEITVAVSFESTPNQLVTFLSEIRNAAKFVTVRVAQVAPVQVVQANPAKGDLKKTVRVNLTLGAILASPPVPASAGKG